MKKIFSSILMLFPLVACSSIQFVHDTKPITKDEKTVLIQYFPTEFEIDLEKTLENNFWKVSVVSNKDTSSPSLKSNFVITCESLYADYLGTYQGIIKFSDLRSRKRIVVYKFKVSTKSTIIENIIKTMDSILGASNSIPSTSATTTQAVKNKFKK
ncbi:hypothetical protein KSU09_01725 [Fusobacterium nucleatum]|uniref:hypothetical protein n=1 Tax=Fusobacterium nucleatum TaxID=851 RepID=UPI0030D472D2